MNTLKLFNLKKKTCMMHNNVGQIIIKYVRFVLGAAAAVL
jgi:hypothetical protein